MATNNTDPRFIRFLEGLRDLMVETGVTIDYDVEYEGTHVDAYLECQGGDAPWACTGDFWLYRLTEPEGVAGIIKEFGGRDDA